MSLRSSAIDLCAAPNVRVVAPRLGREAGGCPARLGTGHVGSPVESIDLGQSRCQEGV